MDAAEYALQQLSFTPGLGITAFNAVAEFKNKIIFGLRGLIGANKNICKLAALVTILVVAGQAGAQSLPPLLHHFRFEGEIIDEAGTSVGTLLNGAKIENGVLVTDGIDDYVQFDQYLVPTSGSMSVAFWIKPENKTDIQEFISQGASSESSFYIGKDGGTDQFRLGDQWLNSGVPYENLIGNWHHIALVVDRTRNVSEFWINGVLKATKLTAIGIQSGGTRTRLATQFCCPEYYKGSLDDLQIFAGALTGPMIQSFLDLDLDGVNDTSDNCPTNFNPLQEDFDNDGVGDACDDCPVVAGPCNGCPTTSCGGCIGALDTDNDGTNDCIDDDDDNDGVVDSMDAFPLDASESVDSDQDGIGNNADMDDDGDGVDDATDPCPNVAGPCNGCPKNACGGCGVDCESGYAHFGVNTDTILIFGNTTFPTVDFTYEMRIRVSANSPLGRIITEQHTADEDKNMIISPAYFEGNMIRGNGCGDVNLTEINPPFAGNWRHVAWVRSGSVSRLYIDGVQVNVWESQSSCNLNSAKSVMSIGKFSGAYSASSFLGDIDWIRVSAGALYSGGFTPPQETQILATSNTNLLLKFNDATVIDNSPNNFVCTLGAYGTVPTLIKFIDTDGDGFTDDLDNCPNIANPNQTDCNSNGVGDACETFTDCNANNVPDSCEIANGGDCNNNGQLDACEIANHTATDCNNNGIPDSCETDTDSDGIIDACDTCPDVAGPCNGCPTNVCGGCGAALDTDNDGTPDCVDNDDDNDGVVDAMDAFPLDASESVDSDQDGIGNNADMDDDGDGASDASDGCPLDATKSTPGQCGCGVPDTDTDGDGVADCIDNCPSIANTSQTDCNGNGVGDACETFTDCNSNNIPDSCEIANGGDCNNNGQLDACEIANHTTTDCNNNGIPDSCEIANNTLGDCDGDGIPNSCEIAAGALDADYNGIPDGCEGDCNLNGQLDYIDITLGSADCDGNSMIDSCEDGSGIYRNSGNLGNIGSGVPRSVTFATLPAAVTSVTLEVSARSNLSSSNRFLIMKLNGGASTYLFQTTGTDCPSTANTYSRTFTASEFNTLTESGSLAVAFTATGTVNAALCGSDALLEVRVAYEQAFTDCDHDGVRDFCAIASGTVPDCNQNGIPDSCDIASGFAKDCNGNGILDSCDIASGFAIDCNGNGIPDSCDTDCNSNGIPDSCDIASGFAKDCNGNSIPDSCDIASGFAKDCNGNGVPDNCDINAGTASDCNSNGILDSCDIVSGNSADLNGDARPDECEADCNHNNKPDPWEVATNQTPDCNNNSVPDSCDIESGTARDCDLNNVPDSCDIAAGALDENSDGRIDACNYAVGDFDLSNEVDSSDLSFLLLFFGEENPPFGDLDGSGVCDSADLSYCLLNFGPLE